jgi:hypothetical protein
MTSTKHVLSLEPVGAALVAASSALASGPPDSRVVEAALLELCGASYEALIAWEELRREAADQAPTWRGRLDELRVQAALAEMELRTAKGAGAAVTETLLRAVDGGLALAEREVGVAVAALRNELSRATR